MAKFVLTSGQDNFFGASNQYNIFYFSPSTLQASDVVAGGATGTFTDVGVLTGPASG